MQLKLLYMHVTRGDMMLKLMVSSSVRICLGPFLFAETLSHLCSSVCSSRLCYSLGMLDAICSLHYPYKQFSPAPGVRFFTCSQVSCLELWGLQCQVCGPSLAILCWFSLLSHPTYLLFECVISLHCCHCVGHK